MFVIAEIWRNFRDLLKKVAYVSAHDVTLVRSLMFTRIYTTLTHMYVQI